MDRVSQTLRDEQTNSFLFLLCLFIHDLSEVIFSCSAHAAAARYVQISTHSSSSS